MMTEMTGSRDPYHLCFFMATEKQPGKEHGVCKRGRDAWKNGNWKNHRSYDYISGGEKREWILFLHAAFVDHKYVCPAGGRFRRAV